MYRLCLTAEPICKGGSKVLVKHWTQAFGRHNAAEVIKSLSFTRPAIRAGNASA